MGMDDFELGLSSGPFFKDDFYESFQAPKFYDFINPRDSGNADEWFLRGLPYSSVKEMVSSAVESILHPDSDTERKSLRKEQSRNPERDSRTNFQCSENDDPNHAKVAKPTKHMDSGENTSCCLEGLKHEGMSGLKKTQNASLVGNEASPKAVHLCRTTRCAANNQFYAVPATVPQKKVLATRKAMEIKQQKPINFCKPAASKSLMKNFREVESENRLENKESKVKTETIEKNYSSEFEQSCRGSEDSPRCKRAIVGQDKDSELQEAADYVVEQATELESAIKLLNIEDNEKKVGVCTEIMGAVCADSKTAAQNVTSTQAVFSFKATPKDNAQHSFQSRKRKSKDMNIRIKQSNCYTKVAPTVCISPRASVAPRLVINNLKKPRVTCPQPFRLRTEERGALKELQFNKKMEQYIALKEGLYELPNATSMNQSKVISCPMKRRNYRVQKDRPRTVDTRSPVEVSIEMVTKDLEANLHQPQPQPQALEVKRRPLPMPSFNRPFKPQRSTKKLTVPIEPKFHTINGRRTCTKHSHAQ